MESSAEELASRNQNLLALYSGEIEAAADKIIEQSPSPVARRQSLVWKADAIPILQNCLLKTDPVAATADAWAFIFQMSAYMDQPAVRQNFGEFHPVVSDTFKRMDTEMEQVILAAAPTANVADLRKRVQTWADAHPIQAGLAGRQSADPVLLRQAGQVDLGAMASIQALQEGLGDITARLDSYNVYAPRQARWQAELLLNDLSRNSAVGNTISNLESVSASAAKASSKIDDIPAYLSEARTALVSDFQGQRLATQAFVDQQRLATLDALRLERIAAMASLHNERLAATGDLRGERQIVLDAIHSEQQAAVAGMQKISNDSLEAFDARARGLIDHFFWRALELMILAFVVGVVATWVFLRRYAPRLPDRGETRYDRAA